MGWTRSQPITSTKLWIESPPKGLSLEKNYDSGTIKSIIFNTRVMALLPRRFTVYGKCLSALAQMDVSLKEEV